jgi:hypothetical protein
MVVNSLIHCVEQFLLAGLISLAIVFATIRAYFAKFLVSMEAAGFSPLFIFSLLGILSIYACIGIIQCCDCGQHQVDDSERGIILEEDDEDEDLGMVESRFRTPISLHWRWDGRFLRFYKQREGAIKLVDEPSGKSHFPSYPVHDIPTQLRTSDTS